VGSPLNLLLDTVALVWATSAPHLLTDDVRRAVSDPANAVGVSAASAWEIATKYRLGRLPQAAPLVIDWQGTMERGQYTRLPIREHHALHAGSYDIAHADPFDRIIAAQAELESMTVVSSDRAFDLFPVRRLW
jgi:PIN domain nuclease of toxin-antitoxin system